MTGAVTGQDVLRFDLMLQRALRGVLREALQVVAAEGLPGAHHFYITFRTQDPGVVIPDQLHQRYPEEMTIVLQHEFWGLEVSEESFSVTLSFSNRSERLTIPFDAVVSFADPSVRFGLQFQPSGDAAGEEEESEQGEPEAAPPEPAPGEDGNVVALDRFRRK